MDENIEIIVKGYGGNISCDFNEPLNIPTDVYEAKMGLKGFSTYNNIPNIVERINNGLKIKVPGHDYKLFLLDTGAYELKVIAEQMQEWIEVTYPKLEKVRENFKLIGNNATSKAEFLFKDDYGVDFDVWNSMGTTLGFGGVKIEGRGRYPGKGIVNITMVTQLIFNCNITASNFINGKEMPFIYTCGVNVPSGYRLYREVTDIAYKKLTTTQISHIRIWVLDGYGDQVELRGEDLTVILSLKLKRRVTPVSIQ